MATNNSPTIVKWLADTKMEPHEANARLRVAFSGIYTTVANHNIGEVIRLVWLPYKARIIGGFLAHGALGSNVLGAVGVVGKSGTTYDNDADLLLVAVAQAAAGVKTLQTAAVANDGYVVSDPDGAYIIHTVSNANADANIKVSAQIFWCMD